MAKADTFGKPAISKDGTGTSFKDYTSLLGVVAAGFLGISLLCITSAIALSAPNAPTPLALEPASIVDLAVNNINTVSALTVQALDISIEQTPILLPSRTPTSTSSPTTISPVFPSATQKQPTKTRGPRTPSTSTPKPPPTNTAVPPSKTPLPPPTNTPIPPDTNTPSPIPPTATEPPTVEPTATDPPPPTEPPTAEPSPTP